MKITDEMLTEWFPDHVKPVHEGIYPTRIVGMPLRKTAALRAELEAREADRRDAEWYRLLRRGQH